MKAILLQHVEESTTGWTPEQIAAIKYAVQIGGVGPITAIHKRGTIVEGELAERCIIQGLAEPYPDPPSEVTE